MADAATTNRGLNDLLNTPVGGGSRDMAMVPSRTRNGANLFADMSFKAIFQNSTRNVTTKKLQEGDRKGSFVLSDNAWDHVDWDPEVCAIDIIVDAVVAGEGVEISMDPAGAANSGFGIYDGETFRMFVAGSPCGRFFIRRTNAGNSGNGTGNVTVRFICYGSHEMLGSTHSAKNVAHS